VMAALIVRGAMRYDVCGGAHCFFHALPVTGKFPQSDAGIP
jgi:hypothetical protein